MSSKSNDRHGHLWRLDDGTPVHAPPGRLTRNEAGQVCCHLCGRWFDHLGAHLRRHGWTAAGYRVAVGLAAGRALCNARLSGRISRRQTVRWQSDPATRESFDRGRPAGVSALADNGRDRRSAPEVAAINARNLERSRRQRDAERWAALERLVRDAGVDSVGTLLRLSYEHGASLAALQQLTGWSRPRVRSHLESAGAEIRRGGQTTAAGRDNRTAILRSRVVERIGTDDVEGWLRAGRTRGLSYAELGRLAGRSSTWVRTQLTKSSASARRIS